MSKLIVLFALCSLLVTGIVATNENCQCNYPDSYAPVCGDNGKSYNNRDELECFNKCRNENVQVIDVGVCSSCKCHSNKMLKRVCGSDGRSYGNPSVVDCSNKCFYAQIKIAKLGKCKPSDRFVINSHVYRSN